MPFNYGLATIGGVFIVIVMLATLQHASRYKSDKLRVISHCYKVFLGILAICMTPYLSVTSTANLYQAENRCSTSVHISAEDLIALDGNLSTTIYEGMYYLPAV